MELLLVTLIVALVSAAVGAPAFYRRRPALLVYDDGPVVYDENGVPIHRRRLH